MKINEELLIVKKTARYYTNNPTSKIRSVNVVIHGYATLAKNFISEFDFLDNENTLIVAPEGLSKFYFRDKLAASWMTKEVRLNEISDYINFLNEVFENIKKNFDVSSSEVNLIGFSQGVHTAVRWFIGGKYNFNKLILCSSDFPADADFESLKEKLLNTSKMFYVYGNQDSIVNLKTYIASMELLKRNQIQFFEITFEGDHRINSKVLNEIL